VLLLNLKMATALFYGLSVEITGETKGQLQESQIPGVPSNSQAGSPKRRLKANEKAHGNTDSGRVRDLPDGRLSFFQRGDKGCACEGVVGKHSRDRSAAT
jgi:hypothetical protein